jgi:hypothetical protein
MIHILNSTTLSVEFVAYEKKDGSWDVYLEEPEGSCPEFDNQRDKYGNVFLSNVENIDKISNFRLSFCIDIL